ncbi:MAG TPA: HAMP domain-containing sensor histidine kinase [Lacipirellulaceae bacterium]|nr:HAMP domain-containing sensor histidine kinase [Lacipirellulaceae bacterium]
MSVASLRKIGALIREQRHVLLARWRHQLRQLPSAQGLDTPSLNDHMPYLIDELSGALESQPDDVGEDLLLQGSPPAHGRQRLHDGFNLEEVVAEYNVLRACIHDVAEEHGIIIHGNDLRIVNRIIDEAVGLAVQTYTTQLSLEIKEHRDQHMAFVANDLRVPLQAISLTVRIIERTLAGAPAEPSANKLLKVLRRNIEQLEKSMVDVIKANGDSSSEAAQKLERRQIDLWPIVQAVISDLEPVISTTSVDVVNDVPADLRVFADAGLLSRVFENAIAFAINSAPRGIVRIEAIDSPTDVVRCQVHHNGAALPPGDLSKLFEDDASGQESASGIGLALAIVSQLIEAHGGSVSAHSSESDGTTIEFRLPAAERSN